MSRKDLNHIKPMRVGSYEYIEAMKAMRRERILNIIAFISIALIVAVVASFAYIYQNSIPVVSDDCVHTEDHFKCVKYVRNYDADTITFEIENLHPLLGSNISIRLRGIDAPELRASNECERMIAEKGQLYVKYLMREAEKIEVKEVSRGKYFRIVGRVFVDGIDLSEILLAKGLAIPYQETTNNNVINWCDLVDEFPN